MLACLPSPPPFPTGEATAPREQHLPHQGGRKPPCHPAQSLSSAPPVAPLPPPPAATKTPLGPGRATACTARTARDVARARSALTGESETWSVRGADPKDSRVRAGAGPRHRSSAVPREGADDHPLWGWQQARQAQEGRGDSRDRSIHHDVDSPCMQVAQVVGTRLVAARLRLVMSCT